MKDLKELKEVIEKEYEFWMSEYNKTDVELQSKLHEIHGRLNELEKIKELLDKGE